MRIAMATLISFAFYVGMMAPPVLAQIAARNSTAPHGDSIESAEKPQFTLVLFWKQQDASTQSFAETLRSAAAKHSEQARWNSIDIKDAANRAIVDYYGVSRAPMPLAVCVADNGAVTGVFTRRPTEEAIERALVTAAMAEVTKALQNKNIVIVHVKRTAESSLPVGAVEFMADPDFSARTTVIDVMQSDPSEARFVTDMKLSPHEVGDSMMVVMAPPGVFVGKFNSDATKTQIIAKLHAAGKCCEDPNCKHNQKAKQQ